MNPGTTMLFTFVSMMRNPCTTSGLVTRKTTGVIGGNDDAGRNEGILLRNDAHNHGAVRLNRRAKILLHEFAGKMQAAGVDRFDV